MPKTEKGAILIVDDNANQCETLSMIMKFKGYQVTTAYNGFEAVETVRQQAFDFILMDIKMPVMNGVEAYRQIREIQPQIRAMLMTAYAVDDLIEQAMALGVWEIAYKPLDIAHMISEIEREMGRS